MTEKKQVKIMKASYMLQSKIGGGMIDDKTVQTAQKRMDEEGVDFAPMAQEFLAQLAEGIEKARQGAGDQQQLVRNMTGPVMQLKANAGMFKATLISNLANIMLNFLESIDSLDNDVIEIVNAHHKTLNLIISNKMEGEVKKYGAQFEKELKEACRRYFTKRGSSKESNSGGFFSS